MIKALDDGLPPYFVSRTTQEPCLNFLESNLKKIKSEGLQLTNLMQVKCANFVLCSREPFLENSLEKSNVISWRFDRRQRTIISRIFRA